MSRIETMIISVEVIENIGMMSEDWGVMRARLKYTLLTKFYRVISGFFPYKDDDETRAGSGLGERDTAGCARGGVGGAKERTEDESAGDHDRWGAGVEVE